MSPEISPLGLRLERLLLGRPLSCGVLPLLALGAVLARFAEEAPVPREGIAPPVVFGVAGEHSDLREVGSVLAVRAPALAPEVRRRLSRTILEESRRASLDPLFILALIDVESEFRRDAVSRSGARGLMQLRDATLDYLAEKEGVRLSKEEIDRDPSMQVRLGIRYLAYLERRFGSLNLGLMAYNAGPERLKQALKDGDVGRFKHYVHRVRRGHAGFRQWRLSQRGAVALSENLPPRARSEATF